MDKVTPYQEGRNAFKAGKKRNANPYHMAHSAHDAWDEGWLNASDDAAGDD